VPEAILIAGANGAGKTTLAGYLLAAWHPGVPLLNLDEIQAASPAFRHPVAAGREVLRRLADRERRRASFAIETTLSTTMYVRRIRAWRAWGYRVSLHFIEVPSEDFAVHRVRIRVAIGGHDVPEAHIRSRYHRGLALFGQVYKPLVNEWYHWVSDERGLRVLDRQKKG
jgi:predicted ABC-type ATPase